MSQYTEKIQETLAAFKYIEEGNQLNCLEAANGRMTKYFNHGGTEIEILRDQEYEGRQYYKGQTITTPPIDTYWVMLNEKYNSHRPFKIVTWWKKLCSMFKS